MAARGDPCRCRSHKCANLTTEPKWVICRPCAVGNHSGQSCSAFEQMRWYPNSCIRCGFDRLDH